MGFSLASEMVPTMDEEMETPLAPVLAFCSAPMTGQLSAMRWGLKKEMAKGFSKEHCLGFLKVMPWGSGLGQP